MQKKLGDAVLCAQKKENEIGFDEHMSFSLS